MPRSDAELVKAALAGDIDGLRKLYERHYSLAVGIARSRLVDEHLAEDAAQEAFATACRRLHALRDPRRFPEWLGTICRRTAIRMARAQAGGEPITTEPIAPESITTGSDEDGRREQVHAALAQLSAPEREIVHLHYFSGLTHDEIARALGISGQAVHGRLQRARRKLAAWISKCPTE